MDWECGVGLFFISLFVDVLISFVLVIFSIHFLLLTFSHFVVLGGSIIACRSIQCHIVALHSDIDIFKSIFLLMRKPEQEHTFRHHCMLSHNEGRFLETLFGIYYFCLSFFSSFIVFPYIFCRFHSTFSSSSIDV